MDLGPQEINVVKKILEKNLPANSKVWIFGSRATQAKKPFSDLDLAIDAKSSLALSVLASLEQDFSESELPYKVDVVDLNHISENFRNKISAELMFFWEK